MRRWVIIISSGLVVLLATWWLATHSYIEISTGSGLDKVTHFGLLDQRTGKVITIDSGEKSIKRLVRKGSHEILVKQGDLSYFSIVKAQGFLSTKKVHANLLPEKARTFVGENPGPCMNIVKSVLISNGCNDTYSNTKLHVDGTATRPPYSQKLSTSLGGYVEGIVQTSEGTIALIKPSEVEGEGTPQQIGYVLETGLEKPLGIPLKGLDGSKTYGIIQHKTGFIVYDIKSFEAFYYQSLSAEPKQISIPIAKDKSLKPYLITTYDETIVVAYSVADIDELDLDDPNARNNSEVALLKDNETNQLHFNHHYASVSMCSPDRLCMLRGGRLEVFEINKNKAGLDYAISNVDDMALIGTTPVLTRGNEMIGFDANKRQGNIDYSLGSYGSCGFRPSLNGYILCLTTPSNEKVALYIDRQQQDYDAIDKKILELAKIPEVKRASVTNKVIYVLADKGALVYSQALQGYGYSPDTEKSALSAINAAIDKIGIDRNRYQVVIP
jgi:hypothetical protein